MAQPVPVNPDLPASYQVPGVYVYLSRAGSAPPATNRRVLLLGYKRSTGTAPAGEVKRILSEEDVITYAGTGSDLHRMYRAFVAQSANTGADVQIMPMNAPSGTAQTRLIKIMAAPAAAVLDGTSTTAAAAGFVSCYIAGYRYDAQIATGDTYATIAQNLYAQIIANQDNLPCTASIASDTITLTARHAALTSADLPVMVTFSNASMSVAASLGTLTFATAAAADGSVIIYMSGQSASYSFLNADTVNSINAGVIAAINAAAAFPIRAAQPSTPGAVATLFYNNDRVINWNATAITTAATTTLTPAWGANAAGLPSSASPSLSTVLTALNSQDAFKLWVTNFTGAGSTVTNSGFTQSGSTSDYGVMGTISSNIEQQANGLNNKGQIVVFADTRSLAFAGSIPSGTSPALTASPRYFMGWLVASPQQAVESAARMASIIIGRIDYPPFNYAGQVLQTDGRTPYLLPNIANRASDSDCNSAMLTYFMTPLRANPSNQIAIMSGRTTAKPSASLDFRYSFWGVALSDDYIRDDLRASLPFFIQGKNLKLYSPPRTQYTTDREAIKAAVASRMVFYDTLDIFDGAEDLVNALQAEVNVSLPQRLDVKMPKRFAIPLEQVSVYTQLVA